MKDIKAFYVAMLVLLLAGCGKTPDCGDAETIKLVKEIAKTELMKALPKAVEKLDMSIELVTMTARDESVDAYACAAQLRLTGPAGDVDIPITFNVRQSATDSGQFVVEVYGL